MLGDRTIDKDFDVNNVYLNLNFEDQEETFEYKYPQLDHPSNYQLTVTKFLAKLNEPYIKLHESKKQNNTIIQQGKPFYFDYMVAILTDYVIFEYETEIDKDGEEIETEKVENIYKKKYITRTALNSTYTCDIGNDSNAMIKSVVDKNPYLEKKNSIYYLKEGYTLDEAYNWKFENHARVREDDEYSNIYPYIVTGTETVTDKDGKQHEENIYEKSETSIMNGRDLYWHPLGKMGDIYSINQFLGVINNALEDCFNSFKMNMLKYKDPFFIDFFKEIKEKSKGRYINFVYEDGRLKLKIDQTLASAFSTDNFYSAPEIDNESKLLKNNGQRNIQLLFSENLFRYLKGIKLDTSNNNWGYYPLGYTKSEHNSAKFEEIGDFEYNVYEGEKINIMDWSDYIGIAVTSTDLPIKRQIYPHFMYDFNNFSMENRRRYYSDMEENIEGFSNVFADEKSVSYPPFDNEFVNEQIKKGNEEGIVFIKYFGKGDDINNINYENNDGNTLLKLDLINTTPLQKFTLKLYWIDRYNNFIPLVPNSKGTDDIIKMQLHFQRIKGPEKENRYIIEPINNEGETVITGVYDDPAVGRVVVQNNPETGFLMEEVVRPPPKKQKVQNEEEELNPLHELY